MSAPDGAAPCGHTDPVNGCECGDRVRTWWAETLRRLAEASPARFSDLVQDQHPAPAPSHNQEEHMTATGGRRMTAATPAQGRLW